MNTPEAVIAQTKAQNKEYIINNPTPEQILQSIPEGFRAECDEMFLHVHNPSYFGLQLKSITRLKKNIRYTIIYSENATVTFFDNVSTHITIF